MHVLSFRRTEIPGVADKPMHQAFHPFEIGTRSSTATCVYMALRHDGYNQCPHATDVVPLSIISQVSVSRHWQYKIVMASSAYHTPVVHYVLRWYLFIFYLFCIPFFTLVFVATLTFMFDTNIRSTSYLPYFAPYWQGYKAGQNQSKIKGWCI